jgi:hypothetical protein
MRTLLASLFLLTSSPAFAGKLAGVSMPDSVTVGGTALVLNGMGLREKYFIDIYVAGLYVPQKTSSASTVITQDTPKQITMHMTYDLSKDKLAEAMREGLATSTEAAAKAHTETLAGWMETVAPGDKILLTYVPGTGTTVTVKGKAKGTIPGPEFMRAIWGIYVGPKPPTSALKKGLLGQ